MYVQQWQDDDARDQEVCGVRVDSIAVAAKVQRLVIASIILGGIEIGACMHMAPRAS
jgi:hypothetical protein